MKISTRLENIQRIFLDTAPVIYFVEKNPNYLDKVRIVFERLDEGSLSGAVTPVTLSECLVLPFRMGNDELVQAFIQILGSDGGLVFVVIDNQIASQSASLRARYNLTLPDAFQAAAALAAGCDASLKRVSELNVIVLDDVEVG